MRSGGGRAVSEEKGIGMDAFRAVTLAEIRALGWSQVTLKDGRTLVFRNYGWSPRDTYVYLPANSDHIKGFDLRDVASVGGYGL